MTQCYFKEIEFSMGVQEVLMIHGNISKKYSV